MTARYDVLVVGAGIIGLATTRALLVSNPQLRVAIVDKEATVGAHQTGRNSGVLHSGIYYQPGSLKARLCIRGKHAMQRYADERGVPIRRLGKLIIAADASELERLAELRRRAELNGVAGIRRLESSQISDLEPDAVGLAAIHAPETAVVDFGAVARALAEDVRSRGCALHLGRPVTGLATDSRGVSAASPSGPLRARHLIACAGLQSDRLARLAGLAPTARIIPFRGDYYTLGPAAAARIRGLVYPVPDPAFPFLGVHFTRKIDGTVVAGPNAVLALAREQYRRLGFRPRDAVSALGYRGLWRFAGKHGRVALGEAWRDLSKRAFVSEMQRYVPAVQADDVTFGPTGIRAQAMTASGQLVDDFLIAGGARMMHVLNAPSPGATASLAIGAELAERALRDLITE